MIKRLILFGLLGFLACEDELPLIYEYDNEWQLDVGSQFIENNVRPEVWLYKTVEDGSLLIGFYRQTSQLEVYDNFLTKVSASGQIVRTIYLPSGYRTIHILDDDGGGYTFTMRDENTQSDYVQLKVSGNLEVSQTSFTFHTPLTFHILEFFNTGILQFEYNADPPGIHAKKFNYQEQLQWSRFYEPPFKTPFATLFPNLEKSHLLFFSYNAEADSLALMNVDERNGDIEWTKFFPSRNLFGAEGIPLHGDSYFKISDGVINFPYFDSENRIFYLAQIDQSSGWRISKRSTRMTNIAGHVAMATTTKDGGYIMKTSDVHFTHMFKTDRKGTIGWTGDFLDAGRGWPIENNAGDLYVISDGYVFKLKARR